MKTLIALLIALPLHAHAYFVASPQKAPLDSSRPTHIIVSGRGGTLSRQPQLAALGVAARLQQAHPNEQIVIMSVFEDATNRRDLEAKGIAMKVINDRVMFNTSTIVPELSKFTKIASLQFFGHNSPSLGTQTDGDGQRFDYREARVQKLKGHFAKDGYIFIHGCNGGWLAAQALSLQLGVPVAGAFEGTHFERLNENKNFYVADRTQTPNLNWAKANERSFDQSRDCALGGCLRMRPENAPYKGHWGDIRNGALSFYKFFCVKQTQDDCDRALALSLINSLTTQNLSTQSSRAEIIAAAKDFVCPSSINRVQSSECHRQMDIALQTGDASSAVSSRGNTLQCSFKSCEAKFTCTTTGGVAGIGECKVQRLNVEPSTTQANEFLAYVRGFDQLAK